MHRQDPQTPTVAVDLRALVPEPTGIGVYTRSLLLALARRGNLRLLGMAHRPVHDAPTLEGHGIALECHAAPLGVIWQQWVLPGRLQRGDVDLFWSPLMTLPLRLPVPGVVTVHDLTALLFPETHRLKVRLSLLPFLRPSLERASRVVTISQATASDLRFHFPESAGKLQVILPGIDPEFCPGTPGEITATRRELGCPEGYLLYVGTVEPRKNLATLLAAWKALRRDDPETPPLVVAGPSGWGEREVRRRLQELAEVGLRYLGRLERARLVRVMQGATLFVYPSIYEGFGLPPAEAMACGIPTIVTAAASLPEVVEEAGVLVPPEDPAALAEAIRDLLHHPARAEELGRKGLAQARKFTWERAAQALEELFWEVLRLK